MSQHLRKKSKIKGDPGKRVQISEALPMPRNPCFSCQYLRSPPSPLRTIGSLFSLWHTTNTVPEKKQQGASFLTSRIRGREEEEEHQVPFPRLASGIIVGSSFVKGFEEKATTGYCKKLSSFSTVLGKNIESFFFFCKIFWDSPPHNLTRSEL